MSPYEDAQTRQTRVSIEGECFLINGIRTYSGRVWQGKTLEGLLFNARMVQGIFDDSNPETRGKWAYPDTGVWDANRNTAEFVAAMSDWYAHGLRAITLNLQGGSPEGYSREQPWTNSALNADGSLQPQYMARLKQILDRADALGMVVILGIFYFGQEQLLRDEQAIISAVDHVVDWLFAHNYQNILIEINNECDIRYTHSILQAERVHELILRVKDRQSNGRRLPVSTSYSGGTLPRENIVGCADFLLLHGNGIHEPERIGKMVKQTRQIRGYHPVPIVINEDDHYCFEHPVNNLTVAISERASWGYFDYRRRGEGYDEGFQSLPVNWGISAPRKRAFFRKLREITGDGN